LRLFNGKTKTEFGEIHKNELRDRVWPAVMTRS